MPLWPCSECAHPAVRRAGDCLLCEKHLCSDHLRPGSHKCPDPDQDWEEYQTQYIAAQHRHFDELRQQVDVEKLCARASELRDGVECAIQLSNDQLSSMMGNQNCHAVITFKDNVEWLARFRLTWTPSPPREVRDYILQSEAATMTYLNDRTGVPAPKIFDWACESDTKNAIGVGYIIMEKLQGSSLYWPSATSEGKEKILQQLANIYLDIEKFPFDAQGSLFFSASERTNFELQALANWDVGGGGELGPFASPAAGSRAIIERYIKMIHDGEINGCHHDDIYLEHCHRLDLVDKVWNVESSDNSFYLKHPDDKGDHILINKDYDIVGIVDWEWTSTTSKAEAFSSPCMIWPVGQFYEGSNELSSDELRLAEIYTKKGRKDLAMHITEGRKVQRLLFSLGPNNHIHDHTAFTKLFNGLQQAFGSNVEWEEWKEDLARSRGIVS